MDTLEHTIDWQKIGARLRAPFDPSDVDFRPQSGGKGSLEPGGKAQAICYIDARAVADRLDEVVGPGVWSFAYQPLVIDKGEVQLAKGALTIHGVTKEDIGDASTFATSKGCVSDALKRAAVLWGIGRYLYAVESAWVTLDQYKRISASDLQRLRAALPRPDGTTPAPVQQAAFVAKPPALKSTTNEALKPFRAATPEQWSALRKLCAQVGAPEPEPGTLTYDRAGAMIGEYSETYKRLSVQRQLNGKAGTAR